MLHLVGQLVQLGKGLVGHQLVAERRALAEQHLVDDQVRELLQAKIADPVGLLQATNVEAACGPSRACSGL